MRSNVFARLAAAWLPGLALGCMVLALSSTWAEAQTNTARISGTVTGEDGTPVAGVTVAARSLNTNFTRGAVTSDRGFYVIAGLPPDEYELTARRIGLEPQTRRVRAQIGQSLNIDLEMTAAAVQLSAVQVLGTPTVAETRSVEVASNISREQIEHLPLNDRDFLEFATLAPGVVPSGNRNSITTAGLSPNLTNVYIDGASFKNEVLTGGVAGQDASGGNPFPQGAVQEFRVISQQYKAEYAKATSAIITATTKSGTNQWRGDVFYFGQNENAIARTYFQRRTADFRAQDFGKNQFGGSIGGPIVTDRLFVFASFEGNHQNLLIDVNQPNTAGLPQTVADDFAGMGGTFNAPLRSNLYFGKLTYQPAERHRWELSGSIRDEFEERGFGGNTARSRGEFFNNDVFTGILAHQYTRGNLLNEAHADVQRYRWKPIPFAEGGVGRVYQGVGTTGGRSTEQDFIQDRLTLRNDVTYSVPEWMGAHVFKAGATVMFSEYDITRKLFGNPEFTFRSQENYAFPFQAQMGFGDPTIVANNTQIGLYIQDDWNVTSRLLLSLGVRWDYESNMLNADWVTPDSVVEQASPWLTPTPGWEGRTTQRFIARPGSRDPFMGAIQPRVGFSYELPQVPQLTVFGGAGIYYDREYAGIGIGEQLNVSYPRYIIRFSADGSPEPGTGNPTIRWDPQYLSREGLLGIIQQGNSAARPELPMLPNGLEPPKAYQWSGGLRHVFGRYRASASYTGVRGYNKLTYFFGNRQAWGACCQQSEDFGNLLLAEPIGKTRYSGLYLTVERPFVDHGRWSWGGAINYTLGKAEANIPASTNSNFSLHAYTPGDLNKWHPDDTDERHRVVANFMTVLPFDVRFSGIVNLGSGRPFNVVLGGDPPPELCEAYFPGATCGARLPACNLTPAQGGPPTPCAGNFLSDDHPPGFVRNSGRPPKSSFIIPNAWAYRDVDVRLQKDFTVRGGQRLSLIAEVFNLFDYDNFSSFGNVLASYQRINNANPTDPATNRMNFNPNFGNPTGVVGESSRRAQVGAKYTF